MGTTRIRVDPDGPATFPKGRIDAARVDATTEAEIVAQEREDEEEAMQDMARYARRVRRRMGLSQTEMARRIDVSPETIRNWEQGKRCPTGAARALLRVLDRAPETALRVLQGRTLEDDRRTTEPRGGSLEDVPSIRGRGAFRPWMIARHRSPRPRACSWPMR